MNAPRESRLETTVNRPELLAPAGDRECAIAAVENGADAIYFGLSGSHNARARATNFSLEELPELMVLLHRRGVRGYLTLNTLVFPGELESLERIARTAVGAGIDAVLVQDLGVVRLLGELCPELPLHASTQMTLSSAECLREAASLGIRRVVLPRELSIDEIAAIRRQTDIELEVFVHGALCISFSGQCLASLSMGGRSANRGQCAQACRMPYRLLGDELSEASPPAYHLSPHDLAAGELLPRLVAAGVAALKIEGRLKSAEYVACVTGHYRKALDAVLAGRPGRFTREQIEEMELVFSRGFCHGWLEGEMFTGDSESGEPGLNCLVPGTGSANQGLFLGRVLDTSKDRIRVELAAPIQRGDGIALEGDRMDNAQQGSRVWEVFVRGRSVEGPVREDVVELSFAYGAIATNRIRPGQRVWKTDDPQLTRRLQKTYSSPTGNRRVGLDLEVTASIGQPLRLLGRADSGASCRIESDGPLAEATKHPLSDETLQSQFSRLGGTCYELRRLEARIDGRPMVPLSVLGKLRHEMVQQLDASIAAAAPRAMPAGSALARLREELLSARRSDIPVCPDHSRQEYPPHDDTRPRFHVLCRSLAQVREAIACEVSSILVELDAWPEITAAVEAVHQAGATIVLAAPRIQKPGEGWFDDLVQRMRGSSPQRAALSPDGLLVRNLAGLAFCARERIPAVADFSLNAANELTVDWLVRHGATRVTASYDLGVEELLDLAAVSTPERLEVVVRRHTPMFHTAHCLFEPLGSQGKGRDRCSQPCRRGRAWLRDRLGVDHPIGTDAYCRNTVYHGQAQSLIDSISRLQAAGIRQFRIELLQGEAVAPVLSRLGSG